MKTVFSIAGFDPSSGAGITADLAVFAAYGLNGISAITALTVQSTAGVQGVHPVAPEVLRSTLDCLQSDLPPSGVKIGMLASGPAVTAVVDYLEAVQREQSKPIVVLDTVLRSSSGRELLDAAGLQILERRLLPLVDWVTPNTAELSLLSGTPVGSRQDVPRAAQVLQNSLPAARFGIFATGGHLEPPDDFLLPRGGPGVWFPGRRVPTRATHGTGCALSSAFLCGLVQGLTAPAAALQAKEYVARAMIHAAETGTGPCAMNHHWQFARRGSASGVL
jgi:hydroxymethylpyrimidine/phosphomethylpyrimidine kinase